jgi:dipeptidyl aminopeptidase/acylaminoacyl peptidase
MVGHRSITTARYNPAMPQISTESHRAAVRAAVFALLALAALLAGAVAYRNYRAARLDFEPWPMSAALRHPELTGVPNLQSVSFPSADGLRIAGWYAASRNRAAIVVSHGTNADRSSMLPELRLLAAAGFGVLAFDWPGDGDSEGRGDIHYGPIERHALTAALTWVAARPEVDPNRIGGLGFSIGGFLMTQVAALDPRLRAIVIEAAPPDYEEYLRRLHRRWNFVSEWPAYWAVRNTGLVPGRMSPREVIGEIAPRPILIIGGALDEAVSPAMVNELYAAAREPKSVWLVPGAHHGGYWRAAAEDYQRHLLGFFNSGLLSNEHAP